jgi:ethanolamine ammonia-lyase small subunit
MQQTDNQNLLGHAKTATQEEIAKMKDKTLRDIGAAKEGNRLAEVNMKRADMHHGRAMDARKAAIEAAKPPPKPPTGKGPPK